MLVVGADVGESAKEGDAALVRVASVLAFERGVIAHVGVVRGIQVLACGDIPVSLALEMQTNTYTHRQTLLKGGGEAGRGQTTHHDTADLVGRLESRVEIVRGTSRWNGRLGVVDDEGRVGISSARHTGRSPRDGRRSVHDC